MENDITMETVFGVNAPKWKVDFKICINGAFNIVLKF